MTTIIVAIIQVLGTIIVAAFTYLTNHKIEKIKDIRESVDSKLNENKQEILNRIDDLEKIVDQNDIDVVRNRIVSFENLCRLDKEHNGIRKYQYETAFKDVTKWKIYHEKYPKLNGEIDVAIENIEEHYKQAIFY